MRAYVARVIEKGAVEACTATVRRESKNCWRSFVLLPGGFYKASGKNPTEALDALADKADLSHVGKLEKY